MKHNKDDRRDNVDRIQYNIYRTIQNIRMAEDVIEKTDDDTEKKRLEAKNDRREQAVVGMKKEIKEEAIDKQNGYK